ncbi:MAG: DUF456 domain-containing protein [Syntrophomonadaceae bacterium]|nr:DUF456 domain-containing protein [Syntrophomonadaceae bacterium]
MQTAVLVVAVAVMLIGVAGTFMPFLPGIPLLFLAIAGYGWYEGFQVITPRYLAVMGGITILSVIVDYLSGVWGARAFGSSRAGAWGAFLGGILGLLVGGPMGIVLGPWLGAFVAEYLHLRDVEQAGRAATGALVGLLAGTFARVLIGLAMLVSFLVVVL